MINGISVDNGQEIDRCDEYQITYTVMQDNVIVDKIFCNTNKVDLSEEINFTKYTGKIRDTNDSLAIMIFEYECKEIDSYRCYFNLLKAKTNVFWTEKYSTVYIKKNAIALTCVDECNIHKIACDSGVINNRTYLSVTAPTVIHMIAVKDKSGSYISRTPLTFLYDPSPPAILDYTIIPHSPLQSKSFVIDITVEAKDTGVAGVDQILFGTYEEYQQWVAKVNNGEYESQHEKEKGNKTVTISNQTIVSNQEYYVWAIDCAANISEPVKLDLQGPKLICNTKELWYNKDFSVIGQADEEIQSVFVSTSYEEFLEHTLKQGNSNSESNKESYRKAKSKNSTWRFSISADGNKEEKYYIWAYDIHGNKSETPCVFQGKIDVSAPELRISRSVPEGKWSREVIFLTLVAKDATERINSGVGKVYYSTEPDRRRAIEVTSKNEEGQYVLQTPTDEKGQPLAINQEYYFWAEDNAGNVSNIQKTTLLVENECPRLTGVKVRAIDDKTKVSLSVHGICCKKDVILSVQAKDDGISSGLDTMELYQNGKFLSKATGSYGTYSFTLKPPFSGELSFRVRDKAGNVSEVKTITQIDSSFPSSVLKLESKAPEIGVQIPFPNYIDEKERKWFSKDITLTIDCKDKDSGVEEVRLWVNEKELLQDSNGKPLGKVKWQEATINYSLSTGKLKPLEDGSYHIMVQVTDYCGNISVDRRVVYLDTEKPVIGQVTFTSKGSSVTQSEMVKKESYGYYFQGKTRVRIQAKDNKASAGVAKIAYYTVDYGVDHKGIKSPVKVKNVDSDGGIDFVLASGFKGQIYAMAIDCVGHNSKGYSKPYGVIIESIEANSQTANVHFTMPATAYADGKGQPLYQEKVKISFTAEDYFNGIKQVEWKVSSPNAAVNSQAGVIEVDDLGNIRGAKINSSHIKRDYNLVTSLKHQLTIGYNSNDITVSVKITDRSGHIFEKKMGFGIDKRRPTISIGVSEQRNATNLSYYNKGQVVQILVKERNFDPSLVTASIENSYGKTYKVAGWSKRENLKNPDETMYVSYVECKDDGEYTLELMLLDLAGNASNVVRQSFVVDTCSPEVKMRFASKDTILKNKAFYNRRQSMVIAINEHNFTPENASITCKRYANATKSKLLGESVVSTFHTEGEQHMAAMELKEDGWYQIEVTCKDKAGNSLDKEALVEFGIDSTPPILQIEGVQDKTAYNSTVVPTICIFDENYACDKVKIHLSGSKTKEQVLVLDSEGKIGLPEQEILPNMANASITRKEYYGETGFYYQGHSITLNCFPEEQKIDDLYTITVEAEDVAGNRSTQKVDFSVNRFGSVYVFSSRLQNLKGSYVQTMDSVTFTETNVNTLVKEETQIKLSYNGVVKDLVENKDYYIEHVSSDKQWNQYTYTIKGELFMEEGRYTILVHSKDASGNINENDLEAKGAKLEFGVDRTQPIITATNVKKNTTYGETSKTAKIYISDNIALKQVDIYVNDAKVEYTRQNEIYEVMLYDSKDEQNLRIVAIDKAGNETVKKIEHIYVTTSLWIQFWNNHLLVSLTGGSIALLLMGLMYLIYHKRAKA